MLEHPAWQACDGNSGMCLPIMLSVGLHVALIVHARGKWWCSRASCHWIGVKCICIGGYAHVLGGSFDWLLWGRVSLVVVSKYTHFIIRLVDCRCWQKEGGHIERVLGVVVPCGQVGAMFERVSWHSFMFMCLMLAQLIVFVHVVAFIHVCVLDVCTVD